MGKSGSNAKSITCRCRTFEYREERKREPIWLLARITLWTVQRSLSPELRHRISRFGRRNDDNLEPPQNNIKLGKSI